MIGKARKACAICKQWSEKGIELLEAHTHRLQIEWLQVLLHLRQSVVTNEALRRLLEVASLLWCATLGRQIICIASPLEVGPCLLSCLDEEERRVSLDR